MGTTRNRESYHGNAPFTFLLGFFQERDFKSYKVTVTRLVLCLTLEVFYFNITYYIFVIVIKYSGKMSAKSQESLESGVSDYHL